MASTISSMKNIFSDRFWFVKLGLFTGVYFYLRNQSHIWDPDMNDQTAFVLQIVLFILLSGCAIFSMHMNINNKQPFIPGLINIPDVILKSVFGMIAAAPGLLLTYALYVFISSTFHFQEAFVAVLVYTIAALIMSAFIFIPLILLSVRGNIIDAFRYDILLKSAGNYIVQIMVFALAYSLIVGTLTICAYKFFEEMLGDHPALLVLQCIVIVFTFYAFFSFCSDLYGDAVQEIDLEKKLKHVRKIIRK